MHALDDVAVDRNDLRGSHIRIPQLQQLEITDTVEKDDLPHRALRQHATLQTRQSAGYVKLLS
jgi:hypothetical protein